MISIRVGVMIRVSVKVRISIRVVRFHDEYHHTTMHARMMYIIIENARSYWSYCSLQ